MYNIIYSYRFTRGEIMFAGRGGSRKNVKGLIFRLVIKMAHKAYQHYL